MKKGLLFVIGVSASLTMVAQTPNQLSAQKPDLTLSGKSKLDTEQSTNFYAEASTQRNGGAPTTQISGTMFSSSRNCLTLLVSQSNCMTANQALGVAAFTHRISADWSPANVNSGYIEVSWTLNNGTSWDSMYWDNDGSQLFRYPSGAILNGTGNTNMANAGMMICGPYTDGSAWQGYFQNDGLFIANYGHTGTGTASNNINSFPRIDATSYGDSTCYVTGELVADDDVAGGFRGATINRGKWNGTSVTWTMDSIKPTFHTDGAGAPDSYSMCHIAFSANGQYGYAVFFGVQAAASTPETRTFSPIVYNTTDNGLTWSAVWAPFDFSAIPSIAANIYPTNNGGYIKPWFSMSNGSECLVDNNNQLHVICAIESGYSDDNDSLSYTSVPQGVTTHYIYDTYTTGSNTWNSVLIDSLLTSPTTTQSPFADGATPYDLDARIQASISPSRDHIFYIWADTDPLIAGGENAYPNMYGVGIDWSTSMKTAKKQFTFTDDAYWHYNSNLALLSGSTYTIPSSNSIDRDGSHNAISTFDHYYLNNVTFDESEFTLPIGINEAVASFGTVGAYPNPANDVLNLNINLNNNEAVVITMFNTLGQAVITESRNMNAGSNAVQLNTSNLEAGVYMVNVTADNATVTTRVVVQ